MVPGEHVLKLHLGCGGKYLKGYVNIDYPSEKHTIQKALVVDINADITLLHYPQNSVDEIRLHHVFEHFARPVACALLAGWYTWLRPGGTLIIEVPDFSRMAWTMLSPFSSFKRKAEAERHIFGSQEAEWGIHYEGYTPETLTFFLERYGYTIDTVKKNRWLGTRNFVISATRRNRVISKEQFRIFTRDYLANFLIDTGPTETDLLNIWMNRYSQQIEHSWGRSLNNEESEPDV
jgi:predicted SAM-dependent methyltransferase